MSASNRAALIAKTQKVLAKHFKPVKQAERPVLEQLLYACCLENTRYETADETYARLQESMFDWNEIRVTTVRELSELMKGTPDATKAATQLKHTLHSVFESVYSFELDTLKKQNLGAAVKQLEGYRGTTPFSVSYVVQNALGGHAIPLCEGSLNVLYIAGVASQEEANSGRVPGLERAIPKTKGAEFSSILHQLGAELAASPFSTHVRSILLEMNPDAKERLPKRGGRKTQAPKKKGTQKKAVAATTKKKKEAPKATMKKAPTAKKKKAAAPKKKVAKKKASGSIAKRAAKGPKKSASKQLARRKPR